MPGIPTLCDKSTDGNQMIRGNRILYAILSYISVNTVDIYDKIVQFEASVLGLHQYEFYATNEGSCWLRMIDALANRHFNYKCTAMQWA